MVLDDFLFFVNFFEFFRLARGKSRGMAHCIRLVGGDGEGRKKQEYFPSSVESDVG